MMLICLNCHETFDESEVSRWTEMHGFSYGPGEVFSASPCCGDDYAEAEECARCGAYVPEGTLKFSEVEGEEDTLICEECLEGEPR